METQNLWNYSKENLFDLTAMYPAERACRCSIENGDVIRVEITMNLRSFCSVK